ncbi:MAG: UDP-3-O-(3-hydroxymyristoyl)glucosamine N-acyltransferase [Acidiferrobacteraceae bacterium]
MSDQPILSVTVGDLARCIGAVARGDEALRIKGLAPLDTAGPNDLAYVAEPKYRRQLGQTRAGAVILMLKDADAFSGTTLIMDNPRLGFARAAHVLRPEQSPGSGIHPSAVVAPGACVAPTAWIGPLAILEPGAVIGAHVTVGPGCYVGSDTTISAHTRLVARVTVLAGCVIGERCIIHPGAVIGSDGFGYARDGAAWVKIAQLGRVVIGDDVEIGSNTSIDRGALGDTVLEDGVKLDNLIQVGHNVHIGAHSAVAGCVGIAGSAHIGKRCLIGGGAGIGGHLDITDDVTVMGKTSITGSITEPGVYSSTMSAQPVTEWRKNAVRFRQLDQVVRRLMKIEEKIKQMLLGEHFE